MKTRSSHSRAKLWTMIALLVAGAGIVIQIASGAEYPAVPPGLVLLLGAAGLVAFGRHRWMPVIAVVVSGFLLIGVFASGRAVSLRDPGTFGDGLGLWVQVLALIVAFGAGTVATLGNRRDARSTAGSGTGG